MLEKKAEAKIRCLEPADERQYMINETYEVYEKQGAPLGAMAFHYHNFYEIIYVLEGEYSSMVENQIYHMKKGDFLLINCNVMHRYYYEEKTQNSSKRIILWITEKMLTSLGDENVNLKACFEGEKQCAYHFPVYFEEMLRNFLMKLAMPEILGITLPGAKLVLDKGCLTLFFVYLNGLCKQKENQLIAENMTENPFVDIVSKYIEQHIEEAILVEDLAETVHMSKYHFLRKFKNLTGVTAHTFLIQKRLIKACEYLKEGMSITQVYQLVGFQDYSAFLRNFKAVFGVAPRQYKDFY